MTLRVLARNDLIRTVSMDDAIGAARVAFAALAGGQAIVPLRTHLTTANGLSLFMPAYLPRLGSVGLKVVTVNPDNATKGLPTVQAAVVLIDESTGQVVALLDGTYLTQLRTGAAMGLAADLLARPDAETVALFGAGATARTSLWAICRVRPIREVRVVHPRANRFPEFVAAMSDLLGKTSPSIRRIESPTDALAGASIVITATTSSEPVFPGESLESGTFVGALGAYTPRMRELDTRTILRSRLIVDTREAALHEAGDVMIPIQSGAISADHIRAELGEVVLGTRIGRVDPNDIVVFKSVGNAMQDLSLASVAYEKAARLGLGTTVDL